MRGNHELIKTAKQKRLWDKEERNHDQKFKANERVG
jgi:hypothetical protein